MSAKHLVTWDLSVFKSLDVHVVFQTAIFLFGSQEKWSSGIDNKITDCLSKSCLYYRYFEVRFR